MASDERDDIGMLPAPDEPEFVDGREDAGRLDGPLEQPTTGSQAVGRPDLGGANPRI